MFSIQLIAPRRVGSSAKTLFNEANIGVCSRERIVRLPRRCDCVQAIHFAFDLDEGAWLGHIGSVDASAWVSGHIVHQGPVERTSLYQQ